MKIVDPETGEEREVFTADDVAKQIEDAKIQQEAEHKKVLQEYESKITDSTKTLDTLNKEKAELESKLKGDTTGGQVDNFKILKAELDKKSEEIANVTKELGEIKSKSVIEQKNTLIGKVAGKDQELKKKIELFYEKDLASMPEDSIENIAKKVEAASKLAGEVVEFDPLSGAVSGAGGRGEGGYKESNIPEFSTRERQLGAKLGITDEDYKKYGSKVSKR